MRRCWNVLWACLAALALGCSGDTGTLGELVPADAPECGADSPCPDGLACTAGICVADEADVVQEPQPDIATPPPLPDTGAGPDAETTECEGEGCLGAPCDDPEACVSGLCVEHMGEAVCTETCEEGCPEGWSCEVVDEEDGSSSSVCVSPFATLCRPCATNTDCASAAGTAACVGYGDEGMFCGADCAEDTDCPAGYVCETATSADGVPSAQCINADGVCDCASAAIEAGASTPCSVTNENGTCDGVRTCGADGLMACDAQVPAVETCNGVDDDCDGTVDAVKCDDANPCTVDTCEGEAGCVHQAMVGELCDDGQMDTAGDACDEEGQCVGTPIDCPSGPCVQDAQPDGEGCKVAFYPTGAPCDDEDNNTLGDVCDAAGVCAGTTYSCTPNDCQLSSVPNGEGCDVIVVLAGVPCDDGDDTTWEDKCDGNGICEGTPITCAQGACIVSGTPIGDGCEMVYEAEGTLCDDEDDATNGDRCDDSGVCVGTPYTCIPGPCDMVSVPNGTDCTPMPKLPGAGCDDGVADTKDDICDDEGVCAGEPYVCVPLTCESVSVPNGVDCDVVPEDAEVPCSDGDDHTKNDACDGGGTCVGEPYECTQGPCDVSVEPDGVGCVVVAAEAGASCDDGDLTTNDDICDSDATCAGTPYTCEPAQCEASSGHNGVGCDVLPMVVGTVCDDEDLATASDVCDGTGGCVGLPIICEVGVCELTSEPDGESCEVGFEADGAECDDGLEETLESSCDGAGHCVGTPTSCQPGPCELTSEGDVGACEVTYADPGATCDDDDDGTGDDVCDGAGVCAGEPLECAAGTCALFSVPNGEGCEVTYADAGATCDDGDDGTVEDVCDGAGGCAGALPVCGDGLTEGLEGCDLGALATSECAYGEESCSLCIDCQWQPGTVTGYCGDGDVQSEYESCDDANLTDGDGCSAACESEGFGEPLTVGGTASSWNLANHFRGNVYAWKQAGVLDSFDVYLTHDSPCQLGLFVHEVQGSTKTVIWSTTFLQPQSDGFINAGHVGVPLDAAREYGIGVGWSCTAGYHGTNGSCDDYGPMQGVVSYWDNSYPGYTPNYAPPNEGGGCSIVYYQSLYLSF